MSRSDFMVTTACCMAACGRSSTAELGQRGSGFAAALVDLSTVAGNKISNPPWVKFQSAGWVNFPSAPTPGRHRGLSPDFHPGPAGNARRTAVAGGVHQLSRLRHTSPLAAVGLVAGHGRPGHGGLPVGFRGRPDPALRRADPGRHGRRRGADRPGLRGGATGDGHRLADHLRAVSCLWPVRRTPAGRPGPPRLRLRPDRQPAVVRYRRSTARRPTCRQPTSICSSCSAPSSSRPA